MMNNESRKFQASEQQGLTAIEAEKRLKQVGHNIIFEPEKIGFWRIAKHEVTEPMILLLLVVGVFYSLWGKFEDSLTIFAVIASLVLVEVYNEFRAKKAIASLGKIAESKTKCLRNGVITEIIPEDVVPDDILLLTLGTKIVADAKVQQGINLQIDESSLTGESFPQDKKIGDEIYAGSIVISGEGQAEVLVTGKNTRIGKTASKVKEIRPPRTALQLAMKSLAGKLVYLAAFFSILITIIGILRGQDLKVMILTGLSLAFATIPEELPIVITMVLGLGSYALSKNNFLVKKLKAAEALGNATVIVTDKTGTITEGKMRVAAFYPHDEKNIVEKALGTVSQYSSSPVDDGIKKKAQELKVADFNFTSEIISQKNFVEGRKVKIVVRKNAGNHELFASGAPEEVFRICLSVTADAKNELIKQTSLGRRVIAVAYKKIVVIDEKQKEFSQFEKDLDFVGLISFEDPPRSGVKETITKATQAGIRTILVTGDHVLTAKSIANEVGILSQENQVLTGDALDKLTDEELQETVKKISVFARTTPEHKYRIVQALQKNGEVVAVTGDGINDVLALKGADIGIAMGIKGTDVAKDAADVVLADDNYITIAQGIFEGRKFFDNLNKGIKYYLSVKVALILIFLLPVLLGIPMPFAPIQIIILELFMDLAASAGFVAEPKEKNIYARPPRNPKENMVNGFFIKDVLVKGGTLFITVMLVYFYARFHNLSFAETQTLAFSSWIFGHIALAFISRSDRESLFSQKIFANKIINLWAITAIGFLVLGIYLPIFQERLNLFSISLAQLLAVALTAIVLIAGFLEFRKWFNFRGLSRERTF